MGLRPHDLLRLRSPDAIDAEGAPEWVRASLEAAPWVVVRRAPAQEGRIAVGVRGDTRAGRYAAFVTPDRIAERCAPEDLSDRHPLRAHPVFAALDAVRARLDGAGLAWGPAGGAGFELATGRPVLTEASDLDLIVRLDVFETVRRLQALALSLPLQRGGQGGDRSGSSSMLTDPHPTLGRAQGPPSPLQGEGSGSAQACATVLPVPGEGSQRPDHRSTLAGLLAAIARATVRVDVLIETPAGGFALDELFAPGAQILLRAPDGPRLVGKASLLLGLSA